MREFPSLKRETIKEGMTLLCIKDTYPDGDLNWYMKCLVVEEVICGSYGEMSIDLRVEGLDNGANWEIEVINGGDPCDNSDNYIRLVDYNELTDKEKFHWKMSGRLPV